MNIKILSFPLKALDIAGLNPTKTSWFAKTKSLMAIVAAVVLIVTSLIEMAYAKWNVDTIVPVMEAFIAALQVKFKIAILSKQKEIVNCKIIIWIYVTFYCRVF